MRHLLTVLAVTACASPIVASSLPAEYRHLEERHYLYSDAEGLTSFIQAGAVEAPPKLGEQTVVAKPRASLLWRATFGQFAPEEEETYTVGKFIAAGNFGNVYTMPSKTVDGQPERVKGRVIKQMGLDDNTKEEDGLASVYARFHEGDPHLKHLALMDKSFTGSISSSQAPGDNKHEYKFQTGPDQGGSDLAKFMAALPSRGKVDWTKWLFEVRKVIKGLAKGLHQLHAGAPPSHGFVHNDVKPANTFLQLDAAGDIVQNAALGDFGMVQDASSRYFWSEAPADHPCVEGVATPRGGSPIFMPPEALGISNDRVICAPVGSNDMWALGVTLYVMVTAADNHGQGVYPFQDAIMKGSLWKTHLIQAAKRYDATTMRTLLQKHAPNLYIWGAQKPDLRNKQLSDLEQLLGGLLAFKAPARLPALAVVHHPFLNFRLNPAPPPPKYPAPPPPRPVPLGAGAGKPSTKVATLIAELSRETRNKPAPVPADCRSKAKYYRKKPDAPCRIQTKTGLTLSETRQINGVLYCCAPQQIVNKKKGGVGRNEVDAVEAARAAAQRAKQNIVNIRGGAKHRSGTD